MISVALCTYNGEAYIEKQLESIVRQSLLPSEIIVCDDASTDNTLQLVRKISKKTTVPVKILKNPTRLGVVKNFEQAINACEYDYVALSDQDDRWHVDKLKKQFASIRAVENHRGACCPVFCYSNLNLIDAGGNDLGKDFMSISRFSPLIGAAWHTFSVLNVVPGCCVMINRALLTISLPFGRAAMHDWWLALLASMAGEVVFIDEKLVDYRLHDKNVRGVSDSYEAILAKLTNPCGILLKQKANYLASARQFIDAYSRVDDTEKNVDLIEYRERLSRGGLARLFSILAGRVDRQGLMRSSSHFIGCLLSLRTRVD